ncbi:MAG: divergent polysaccharide deacetylase family protein, partial [Sulfurospirillum sp.]|nr:divergent polysaccharide deacetylase family protein [Sulfurospirillum sp.]
MVRKKYPSGTTPKLAIIIDDVSFPWQTRMMKEIPYKVTPAFFPPTKGHPETVRLSHEFPFAMVHLPLEAKYYSRPEEDTLNTTDSIEVIEKRIKRIKEWFPHIVYYNNHTGGYFTSDYGAMDR